MDYTIIEFEKHNDDRGQLVVFLRNSQLKEGQRDFGQIYFVTFEKIGAIRGNHYHKHWREWFGIVAGKVDVELEDIKTGERLSFILDGERDGKYVRLEIGPYIAHSFRSLTGYAALLNYTDKEWSADDTHRYNLIKNN